MRYAIAAFLVTTLLIAACGSNGASEGGAVPPKAAKAAAIAAEIDENPDAFEAILEKHGMTADEFQALMYEIAADEELTAAYEKARAR